MNVRRMKPSRIVTLAIMLLLACYLFSGNSTSAMKNTLLSQAHDIWLIETVANKAVCFDTNISLALSSDGSPHIAYLENQNTLKYASRTDSGWVQSTVDTPVGFGHSSLALDSTGLPHIAYKSQNDLKFAAWDGSSWKHSTIGVGEYGWFPSLKIDSNGLDHLAYLGYSPVSGTQTPKYARFNGTDWEISVIDEVFGSGGISLALDSMDQPHVSYHTIFGLQTAVISNTQWLTTTVDSPILSGNYVGLYNSIAMDSQDRAHISYALYGVNLSPPFPIDLKYAHQTQAGWERSIPDSEGDVGFFSSLALDSEDNPHISYYANDTQTLRYVHWDGAYWIIDNIDQPVTMDGYTSLAIDQNGKAHIAYCDGYHSQIKYAHQVTVDHFYYLPIYFKNYWSLNPYPGP